MKIDPYAFNTIHKLLLESASWSVLNTLLNWRMEIEKYREMSGCQRDAAILIAMIDVARARMTLALTHNVDVLDKLAELGDTRYEPVTMSAVNDWEVV